MHRNWFTFWRLFKGAFCTLGLESYNPLPRSVFHCCSNKKILPKSQIFHQILYPEYGRIFPSCHSFVDAFSSMVQILFPALLALPESTYFHCQSYVLLWHSFLYLSNNPFSFFSFIFGIKPPQKWKI